MEKTYDPQAIEARWYAEWERAQAFAPRGQGPAYCIMLPPPNVTGSLHMGHAFQLTLMDALIRYHRMLGDRTLWQPGTDHAGIATQMVVERQLAAQGLTRHDLGREAFIAKVWEWKARSGGTITRQMRRLGASLDWSRERFTMDEGLSEAVREVFVRLYDDGLIFRGKRLVNWDPVLHTAVSDLEVISGEEQGSLWHFHYPLSEGSGQLTVATTRPETMLGDTAVAVNPKDERYRHLIGKTLRLPLVGREIPIIGDDYVDMAFGTGCVKITPAHDFNDYAIGQRHGLPMINVMTFDARIRDWGEVIGGKPELGFIPEKYRGLDRFEARDAIVHDLEALGLLGEIKPHTLMVPRGDRSGAVIEPMLTDQWFVDLTREVQADGRPGGKAAITAPALACVREGRIKFVPQGWENTYFQWLENIQDWCISRQIWWGHRIPAWYDGEGKIYVARSEEEARRKYGLPADLVLVQDNDVLDTWFSSALWPFSTLGWPRETADLATFYPTSVLVTGFDIIFFWVARMVMMGLYCMGEVPFREVYVHGLVRDAQGQKMSKSRGNVLDPIDLIDGIDLESLVQKRTSGLMQPQMAKKIEQETRREFPHGIPAFGTDALRFSFAALASTGRDIRFDLSRVEGYRNFCNKLWNASRYVLMQCEGQDTGITGDVTLTLADRWIISRLQQLEGEVIRHFDAYRFDLAAQELYEFIWNEYCDWYLELTKPALKSHDARILRGTRRTLVRVLEALLRLLHPLMPFITEEIWQRVAPLAGKTPLSLEGRGAEGLKPTLMLQAYPRPDTRLIDEAALADIEWLKAFVLGVRRIRAEMDLPPGRPLPVRLANASSNDLRLLEENREVLIALARIEDIQILADEAEAPESAIALVGQMKVLIPLAGLIDKEAELERLAREIGKLQKELDKSRAKLANPAFTDKAPAAVVEQERQREREFSAARAQLEAQAAKIRAL